MTDSNNNPTNPASQESSEWESIKVFLIGSPRRINYMIHKLSRLGFAQVSEWSELVPAHKPGHMMSILNRQIPK